MMLRLRQVATVAGDRDEVTRRLHDVLGLEVAFHDPEIEQLDLHNAVLPVGDQFLEVIAPTRSGTTADRYRQRQGGDAGYMLIFQTDDHARHRAVVEQLGIRVVATFDADGFRNMQLHPRDTGGAFFEIDQQDGPGRWHPAGPDWQRAVRTELVQGIRDVGVRCHDPAGTAGRWGQLLRREPTAAEDGAWSIAADDATVRFEAAAPDGTEGIESVGVAATEPAAILQRAEAAGVEHTASSVRIGGLVFDLRT